eukprot:scaffold14075_cov58-Phaeocystis_antarctica.AAC.5
MLPHQLAQSGDRDRLEDSSGYERGHVLAAQHGVTVPSKAPHLASRQCLVQFCKANVEQHLGMGGAVSDLHTERLRLDIGKVVRRRCELRQCSDQDAQSHRCLSGLRLNSNWRRRGGQWRRRRWRRNWDRRRRLRHKKLRRWCRPRRWRRLRRWRRRIDASSRSHPFGWRSKAVAVVAERYEEAADDLMPKLLHRSFLNGIISIIALPKPPELDVGIVLPDRGGEEGRPLWLDTFTFRAPRPAHAAGLSTHVAVGVVVGLSMRGEVPVDGVVQPVGRVRRVSHVDGGDLG